MEENQHEDWDYDDWGYTPPEEDGSDSQETGYASDHLEQAATDEVLAAYKETHTAVLDLVGDKLNNSDFTHEDQDTRSPHEKIQAEVPEATEDSDNQMDPRFLTFPEMRDLDAQDGGNRIEVWNHFREFHGGEGVRMFAVELPVLVSLSTLGSQDEKEAACFKLFGIPADKQVSLRGVQHQQMTGQNPLDVHYARLQEEEEEKRKTENGLQTGVRRLREWFKS
jgi:hypothetical protein